ncbi:MAG: DNA-binding transcriptional regulator [Gammaproteobacteria bacterium]|nr:MAG: DNA-binding transcriptional regulator [Gammaproteobacteria bacterium]TLZ25630.1 MAG: DNA-binding transcriptional regulator [Gammaproteobacteria bacterium]TLZ49819.1 MAG: DNA-binding transcriptional regulator [Gammaproteobacteria bacterium]
MKTHHNVTPRQEALAERHLCAALAALRTPEECRAFLRDLCTPAELQAMADRWTVVDCLKRGLPYRGIHRLTGVSVTTIGRVARFLAAGHGGYDTAARRLAQTRSAQARRSAGASTESTAGVGKRAPRRMETARHE